MNRDIKRLLAGRIDKIIMKLAAYKSDVPPAFVHENYKNTAAYGKFNTVEETNHIINLYKEHTMTQAKSATPVTSLEHALTVARQAEQQAVEAARQATEAAEKARIKLGDSKAAHDAAKVALGKAKLTDAITLIRDVYSKAPVGSAAQRDIHALLDELAVVELARSFGPAFYGAKIESVVGLPVFDATMSPPVPGPLAESLTARNVANMETKVGVGQPRQAKPSPTFGAPYGKQPSPVTSAPSMCATCPLTK